MPKSIKKEAEPDEVPENVHLRRWVTDDVAEYLRENNINTPTEILAEFVDAVVEVVEDGFQSLLDGTIDSVVQFDSDDDDDDNDDEGEDEDV